MRRAFEKKWQGKIWPCGVDKILLDYLLITVHLCVFTLLCFVATKICGIMAE